MQNQPSLPSWLNKNFLKTALECFQNDKTIEVIEFQPSKNFGEHFGSSMVQCKIIYKSSKFAKTGVQELDVAIKAMPEEGLPVMEVIGGPIFETEIKMYKEVIPAMQQLFERSGMKFELAPKLIYATKSPLEIIILQDMTTDGFSAPKTPSNILDESKLIIQRLAQFHAASYYLSENNEYDFSNFNYSIYQTQNTVETFFQDTMRAFIEVVKTWNGFEDYIPRLVSFCDKLGDVGSKCYRANEKQGYNVLNHGDFHLRNLLVKNNQENLMESFRFIDFQLCCWCSPAVDLSYMYGVVQSDSEGKVPKEELTKFYHNEFIGALKAFGFMKKVPTLLDLNIEILQNGALNVLHGICFNPFRFIDWSTMSPEDMMGDDKERTKNFKKALFANPVVEIIIKREIKTWVEKGWL